MRWWLSLLTCIAISLAQVAPADALPKNFRNIDVFYVGGMPSAYDMDEFSMLGIRTIISLHRIPKDVRRHAQELGLTTYYFPWRTRLVQVEDIMRVLENAPLGSVYVHCKHGADRTGAVAAYWLHTRRGYDAFSALAAVISPKKYHVSALRALAKEYSLTFAPVDADLIGRYSGARNGGLEGLKLRGNEWYTRLARNYLIATIGPPTAKPSKTFWSEEPHEL